jgi:hypothetical protein
MKQLFLCLSICFFSWNGVNAQSYDLTAGMRMGTDWGLSTQFRVAKKVTIEGILQSSLQREEVLLTALVEQHNPLLTRRMNFYYGIGFHKGWINSDPELSLKDPAGVTMIAGLEFTIAKLNLSYDIKPAVNITGGEHRFYTQSGISMRYVIAKKNSIFKVNKKKQRERRKRKRQRARAKRKRN